MPRVLLVGLLVTLLPGPLPRPAPPDAFPRVVVVISSDAEPYQQALAGLKRELANNHAALELVPLHGDTARARDALLVIRGTEPPAAVVTLGTLATRLVLSRVHDVPVVAGMILTPAELGDAVNATAVYLEYPVEVEIDWITRMLPNHRRVGVVYHDAESGRRVERARRLASIQAIRIDGPSELPDALQQLVNQTDVLWSLNDPVVYNPETARSLLLFSLRNRIPMVGQSTAWVRAGALYALDRDYDDVGAQCAQLTGVILGGAAPAHVAPVPPRRVRYTVNARTADEIGVVLPDAILRGAAEVVR
jgi:putative tryptophan/tyrosine transport system substrate-binding protein